MASPFRVFRKNVKPLLVVFGCLLILAWVGGSSLTTIMSGSRGGGGDDPIRSAGAVAASWEGGNVTNQELDSLVVRRAILRGFLDHVEGLGAQPAVMAGLDPPPLRVMPLRLPENAQEGVERSVVQTKLFADAAREAGMYVDDNSIAQYLFELGRGRVTKEDMRAIVEGLRANNPRVSIDYLFDGLRDELLSRNYMMSNMYAAQTITPQQRWQDWLQVNDRAVVEAAAIPVESYLVEVKDPTDAELKEFYNEYKEHEAGPDLVGDMELPSARPGFRAPRKIDVQFVQANFNDLVTKTEGEITDEEVAKFYEDNKELFIKADTGLLDDVPAVEETPKTDVPATDNEPTGESDSGKTGASDADSKAGETAEPGDATATEDSAPVEGAPDETPPATPVETPPATDDGTETPAPGDADQSKLQGAYSQTVFRQVAFLQEQETEGKSSEEAAPADESAATGAESTPVAETSPGEGEAPATEAGPVAEPAATTETPPPAASTDPANATEASAATTGPDAPALTPPATTPPAGEKPKEYQPLEEVRDLIRRDLAYRRANERIGTLMDEVLGELTREFNSYFDQVLRAQSEKGERPAPQAALADLAPLAEKHGLTAGKIGPMTWLEFRETPVGKSTDPDTRMPLSSILYGPTDWELYQPILTVNTSDGDRYITMKTSDAPSRVPEFAEVRDKVLRAWKLREAAKIALKDAEKQAADAQKAGSSLVDFYAEKPAVQVERVDPFSYYTRGDVPERFDLQRFRLSQPDGIVAAGPELLGRVFELKEGEVGAVLNHDHSIAYVIRVVEHQDTPDALRNAYLAEANSWDGLPAMTERHVTQARNSIVADVTGSNGVDWKRDPDKVREESDAVE